MNETTVFEAHDSYVLGLLFTADSQTLVSAGMDNIVRLWSVRDWARVRTIEGHANSVNSIALTPAEEVLATGSIALTPAEEVLATGSTDQTVKLWSFPAGKELNTLQDRKKTVSEIKISPNGAWVAASSYGGRAMVWKLTGEEVVGIKASKKNLSSLAFSLDSKVLVTSGLGDDIAIWALPY
jgi:WD40 repeat protein